MRKLSIIGALPPGALAYLRRTLVAAAASKCRAMSGFGALVDRQAGEISSAGEELKRRLHIGHAMRNCLLLPLVGGFVSFGLAAQTSPQGMPAHDAHQGCVISADPYIDAARSKEKFGKKHPYEAGVLALEVGLRNDTENAISVNLERIRLMLEVPGERKQSLEPLALDDAADRIAEPGGTNPVFSRSPLPGRKVKGGRGNDWQKLRAALTATALSSDILPPHSTTRGFLFFDVNQHFDWLAHASLYVPELRFVPSREELLYFEVGLAPALRH